MIKLNKKIIVVIVCILLIIAVFFVVYLTADNKTVKKSITSEKYETASVTASMFTASCMSDTTLSKNEDFSMVDPKAEGLKSFISEKKEKAEVRNAAGINPKKSVVTDVENKKLGNEKVEVTVVCVREFDITGEEVQFRIRLKEDRKGRWKVISAVSTEMSSLDLIKGTDPTMNVSNKLFSKELDRQEAQMQK